MGIPKSRIQVPKKLGILSGIVHFLLQILCFAFIRSGSGKVSGTVGYIPDLEKSGSGSPKKVWFGSDTRKFG